MTEPEEEAPDALESDLDAAIVLCGGDVRAALRAVFIYNRFLEHELETVRAMVSAGYARGKLSLARAGSKKLDDWRELSSNVKPKKGLDGSNRCRHGKWPLARCAGEMHTRPTPRSWDHPFFFHQPIFSDH
jgi:hypothetical protein